MTEQVGKLSPARDFQGWRRRQQMQVAYPYLFVLAFPWLSAFHISHGSRAVQNPGSSQGRQVASEKSRSRALWKSACLSTPDVRQSTIMPRMPVINKNSLLLLAVAAGPGGRHGHRLSFSMAGNPAGPFTALPSIHPGRPADPTKGNNPKIRAGP
jgi:hypothetical protein